jgi:hypothetical protein
MTWLAAIQRDRARLAMMLQRFAEERLCCRDIARAAEVRLDRFPLSIDGAVEIHPTATHLDISFIGTP